MKQTIVALLLLSLLSACHKENKMQAAENDIVGCTLAGPYDYLNTYNFGSINTDSLCEKYQAIWKELLMENNHLTDSFFTNHITLIQSDTSTWNDGISFSICYEVHVGWAIAYTCDQFIIKIDSSVQQFGEFPRNNYLSKDQIQTIINDSGLSSYINEVAPINSLQFSSSDVALKYLIKAAKVNTLCITDVALGDSAHLYLEAYGQYTNKVNSCRTARLDLETGKTYISEGPCYID
ncbi:MAG TPA: hypothetical protein VMU83_01760 [Hanamia sp.]|nr:hypothetical protein [Hanamia sp.]